LDDYFRIADQPGSIAREQYAKALPDPARHISAGGIGGAQRSPSTSEAEFEAITAYFQPPSDEEQFNVVRCERL